MEVKKTCSAGGVVMNAQNKFLVASQWGTSWSLPKGHMEEGENLETAARREIHEESGITELVLIEELGSYQRYRVAPDGSEDPRELKTITVFLFVTDQDILKPLDPDNPEARWAAKEEVEALLTHERDREFWLSIKDRV